VCPVDTKFTAIEVCPVDIKFTAVEVRPVDTKHSHFLSVLM
jgi:hypothetical protein